MIKLSLSDIKKAKSRLAPFIKKSRLSFSPYFSEKAETKLYLKWETEQETKSFKVRGALNKILSLSEREKKKGLIACSAGNHAQGVALAARLLNLQARVVMMEKSSPLKVESARKLGAKVILKGKNYQESYRYAQSIKGDSVFIHPFADPKIIAGQATVGIEIVEDLPEVESVVVSTGGGGLLSGVSFALKKLKPSVKVYGASWAGTSDFCRKFHQIPPLAPCLCGAGETALSGQKGLTDGIAVQKSSPEVATFASAAAAGLACVSEEEISSCLMEIKTQEGAIVEGSGAAGLAGALKYKTKWKLGKSCCVVISGANIETGFLSRLFNQKANIKAPFK